MRTLPPRAGAPVRPAAVQRHRRSGSGQPVRTNRRRRRTRRPPGPSPASADRLTPVAGRRLSRGVGAADVMRTYLDAMRSGNREAAYALLADDVVGHVPGRSPAAGVKRGKAAVVGYITDAVA